MSSLVQVVPQDPVSNRFSIYDGSRMGDEFLMWHMGQADSPPSNRKPAASSQLQTLYGLAQLYDLGQIDALVGSAVQIFGDSVDSIEFRSQVTPPIVINRPFTPGQKPQPQVQEGTPLTSIILDKAAKPAMYIHLKNGATYPIEPYGTPTEDFTGYVVAGIGVMLALGLLAGVAVGRRLFCRVEYADPLG
jgi:hypothetical protein